MENLASRVPLLGRALSFLGGLLLVILATRLVAGSEAFANPAAPPPMAELVNLPIVSRPDRTASAGSVELGDSLLGRSGHLKTRIIGREEAHSYAALVERFGDEVRTPGIRAIPAPRLGNDAKFHFITMKPWRDKLGTSVNGYNLGWWPAERRAVPSNYENPAGFIEVTAENQDTPLSTHFRLRDFLTHDQERVWPKYVVLREELIDKLELVLQTMQAEGVGTGHVRVLSGFRSPQYNARGAMEGGMARHSRHQFGDAADLIIDDNRDGRMDDLNRDGRVNLQDTDLILRAVERVERKYPELVGGLGLYHEMGPSGPFAHIDVRDSRARWSNAGSGARRSVAPSNGGAVRVAVGGRCAATGPMAVLCSTIR